MARTMAGDVNCDCQVDVIDVQPEADRWRCGSGDGCYHAFCDLNGGGIDVIDMMRAVADWGACCWQALASPAQTGLRARPGASEPLIH